MSFRRRTYRVAAPSACERSAPEGRLNDRRGRLLLVKLEAARLRTSVHPLPALRAWLDSWDGLGAVVTGMERQGYDASLIRYPEGWRAASLHRDHTTRPWVGQVLSFSATPWRAVQVAAREALRKAERERL
jgi:hypothetical protein